MRCKLGRNYVTIMVKTALLNASVTADAPHTVRTTTTDDDKIKALIETNRHVTIREIAEKLNISNSSVYLHLQQLGYVNWMLVSLTN
ncbi:hypothetical protein ANCDUO_03138 [Ancylostoma duodenale]|uniref:Helix-turn-helix type 11 domain-containing protein n=1 Tax=Ancylostoma duodenale TaxID=51022 RepID=A0A0C2HAM3_9BILA|nr:hypothetical protein ANCDUO_03138 [Ancylostoma duodenale]